MWLGGIETPQYFPSIGDSVESPSYKVNESNLKVIGYFCRLGNKEKSRLTCKWNETLHQNDKN